MSDIEHPPCDICGEPSCISDGMIGAELCEKEACFHAAWDKAWGR